jgi:hypothetical protein
MSVTGCIDAVSHVDCGGVCTLKKVSHASSDGMTERVVLELYREVSFETLAGMLM